MFHVKIISVSQVSYQHRSPNNRVIWRAGISHCNIWSISLVSLLVCAELDSRQHHIWQGTDLHKLANFQVKWYKRKGVNQINKQLITCQGQEWWSNWNIQMVRKNASWCYLKYSPAGNRNFIFIIHGNLLWCLYIYSTLVSHSRQYEFWLINRLSFHRIGSLGVSVSFSFINGSYYDANMVYDVFSWRISTLLNWSILRQHEIFKWQRRIQGLTSPRKYFYSQLPTKKRKLQEPHMMSWSWYY